MLRERDNSVAYSLDQRNLCVAISLSTQFKRSVYTDSRRFKRSTAAST